MGNRENTGKSVAGGDKPTDKSLKGTKLRSLWFAPTILMGAFIVVSLTVFWLIQVKDFSTKRDQLVENAESTAENIRLRLKGNQDYLLMLAAGRSDSMMDAESFQKRASRYVQDHPELINITWVDANFVIRDVAPLTPNKQILGLSLELPEPKRASHLARELRKPIYTRPFEAIQGKPSFELWVPVFKGPIFQGLFAAVYSCERLTRELVPPQQLEHNQVGLVNMEGDVLWETAASATTDDRLTHEVPLTLPDGGLLLRFRGYGSGVIERGLLLLELLCLGFAVGLAYAMWRLKSSLEASKKAEESSRKSEKDLREAQRVARIGSWDWDSATDTITWSEEYYRIYGVDPTHQPPGYVEHLKAYTSESATRLDEAVKQNMQTGEPYEVDLELAHSGGTTRWVTARSETKRNARGEIVGLRGTAQDITDRKNAEDSVRSLGLEMQTIYDNTYTLFAYLDRDFNFVRVNRAYAEADGKTPDFFIGKNHFELYPHPENEAIFHNVVATGKPYVAHAKPFEYPDHPEWGVTYWDWSLVPVLGDDKAVTGLIFTLLNVTVQKRAEQKLAQLAAIVASSDDAIIGKTLEGDVTSWNRGAEAIYGYTESEMIGKSLSLLIPPDRRGELATILDKISNREHIELYETVRLRKDGQRIHVSLTISPVIDESGTIVGISTISRDITKRRLAEEQLRVSEEKYRSLVDAAAIGITMISPQMEVLSINRQFQQWFPDVDATKRPICFKAFNNPPRDEFCSYCPVVKTLEDGQVHTSVTETPVGGTIRNYQVISSPVRDSEGNIIAAIEIVEDITDRQEIEQRLRESEERLRLTLEATQIGIWDWDVTNDKWYASPIYYTMLGYEPKTGPADRSEWMERTHPDDRAHVTERIQDVLSGDFEEYRYETRMRHADGSYRWVQVEGFGIERDQDGQVTRLLGIRRDITERKLAEEALRSASLYTRSLIEVSLDPLVTISPIGTIMDVNRATELATGVSRDNLIGSDFCDYFTEPEKARQGYQLALAQGWVKDYPLSIRRVSGQAIDVLYNAAAYRNEAGVLQGVFAVARDITKRKLAEEALQTSERKFRSLFEESLDCLFVTSPEGQIVDMNKKGVSLFGYDTKEEIFALDLARDVYANPEDRKRVLGLLGDHGDAEYEVEVKKKNGETFTAHCLLYASKSEDGVVTSYRGTLRDVTDKRQAEEELRQAKEDWERTFDAVTDLVFIQDTNGRILRTNRALSDRLKKTPEELSGMRCYELMHDSHTPPANCPRSLMLSSGSSHVSEITESCLCGSFLVNISPIRDTAGTMVGSVHVARDITETKRLQDLESRAQRLDTAGRIAGQVAHDLNNLLAPITAYPDLIRELLPQDDPSQKYLDAIESAGSRIAEINQQLLTLSRRGHYSQDVLHLNAIVDQAIEDLGALPEGVSCEAILCSDLMNIIGGNAQLHRVILNLLANARDAVGNSGHIVVRTENIYVDETTIKYDRVPKGEYAKVTISDNGTGIPPEIVQKIFDPFFTTKTTDRRRGSGLGLSVVEAVVKDHRGYIDLHTEVGKGTSFYLYFPVTRESLVETVDLGIPTGSESIIAVDDDDVQRDVLSRLLSTLGYQVTTCETGEKAIAVLREHSHDLMIVDMIMPGGIDGVETYRQALEINPNQRAIIVSGFSETEKVHEALAMGAGAFVKKPLNRSIIATAVRTELDKATKAETEPTSIS